MRTTDETDRCLRALIAGLLLAACGGPARPAAPLPGPPAEAAPASPIELVTLLDAIAHGRHAGSLDDHVDHAFEQRLRSGSPLGSLFRSPPPGCTPVLSVGQGYTAVAIPPPMVDDPPEVAARTAAIVEDLEGATEVSAACTTLEPNEDGEATSSEHVLYVIAVRRGPDGRWLALAWRDFRDEQPSSL